MQSTVKLTVKFYIQAGSAQMQCNVCHHKMDESSSIMFRLSCSDKIKCIQQFKHELLMNFKNLERCVILKISKTSTLVKLSSVF